MKIEIIKNDFGYSYRFFLKEPDGTASDLTEAQSVKLRATHSEFPESFVEHDMVVDDAATGAVVYTLAADDFIREGVYYGEIQVTLGEESGEPEQQVTYSGFTLIVLPRV